MASGWFGLYLKLAINLAPIFLRSCHQHHSGCAAVTTLDHCYGWQASPSLFPFDATPLVWVTWEDLVPLFLNVTLLRALGVCL